MAALASHSCIGSLCQPTEQKSSRATSHGYGVRVTIVSPPLHTSFSGLQTKLGSKSSTKLSRRKQGGVDFRSEQLKLVASAVAGTDADVATSSTTTTTSVLGLEVMESLHPNSRVRLSVTVPATVCKDIYNDVIKEFSKKAKVPGFRPGKRIPESVLVNYIGPQQVRASAVEAILKKSLPEALSSVAGRALKESEHIISKFQDLEASFSSDAPLSYLVAVDVAPEVKWKSENAYKNLKVKVELDPTPTPEEAADAEYKSRVKGLGSLQVAPDRGLEIGDVAIIDISANRLNPDGTEGEKVLSAEQKGFQLDTEDFANFIPGFVEALLNIRREGTRSFDLVFPQTWQQAPLRGIQARFTGYCKEIFTRNLPELDDTFAPKLIEGLTTLDQVKEVLLEKHRINIEHAKVRQTQLAVTEELSKVVEIEVPNSLLEEQGRQMYGAKLLEMQTAAKLTKEQVVQFSSEQMVNNFLTSQKERIMSAVKQTLAVAEIYKLENLEYTEEELKTEVQMALEEFKRYNQEYDETKITEQAKELLEGCKVLEFLIQNGDITYTTKKEES
ncbi:unnamed protein product [Calypogeia fissa]